jgi:hypothetical protein
MSASSTVPMFDHVMIVYRVESDRLGLDHDLTHTSVCQRGLEREQHKPARFSKQDAGQHCGHKSYSVHKTPCLLRRVEAANSLVQTWRDLFGIAPNRTGILWFM